MEIIEINTHAIFAISKLRFKNDSLFYLLLLPLLADIGLNPGPLNTISG